MKTKKMFSKVFALLLALATVLSMSMSVFAATGDLGTITITNAAIGKSYSAYKVFDATYNSGTEAVSYTISTSSLWYQAVNNSDLFVKTNTDTTGVVQITRAASASDTEIIQFLKRNFNADTMTASDTKEAESSSLTLNVPYGYYYINTTNGSGIEVNTAAPSVSITDKTEKDPTPSTTDQFKQIVTENGNVVTTSVSIGKPVKYKLSLNTVNYINNAAGTTTNNDGTTTPGSSDPVTSYTFQDTSSNVKIDTSTVKVYVSSKTNALTLGTDYTLSYTKNDEGKDVLLIVVDWYDEDNGTSRYDADSVLTVEYTAEVTSVDANGVAKNTAQWKYNNEEWQNPNTPEVKTYSIGLTKVDGTDKTTVLSGAKFSVYEKVDKDGKCTGDPIKLVDEGKGVYRVANTTETSTTTTVVTPSTGIVTIKGLGNGDYYFEETAAPAGYNLLTSPVHRNVSGANVAATAFKIENNKGSSLPTTGGIGTTIFYVVGTILVAGATITLVVRKRMSNYRD